MRWHGVVVGIALALAGCEGCGDAARDEAPSAARPWPEPHVEGVVLVDQATLAAHGSVVVVADASTEPLASPVAFDVAQRTVRPVIPSTIDGARILLSHFPSRGVSADGRYVAALCATMQASAPSTLVYAICVRDRLGGAHLVRGPSPSALAGGEVWLSGDGSTLVARSVEPGRVRILRAARDERELREIFAQSIPESRTDALGARILDVAHDGAFLLGEPIDPAADLVHVHLFRGDEPPRRLGAELATRDAFFGPGDGAAVELVLEQGGESLIRRRLDLASGALGEARLLDPRAEVSSPSRRATLDGATLRIEGDGAPREHPLPTGLQRVRLRAVGDDGHVLAVGSLEGRRCLVLLGGAEPLVVGCAE